MIKTSNKNAKPTIFIIFGGTGDLTLRKILPALYNLFLDGWLPEKFAVIGTSSTKKTDQKYIGDLLEALNEFSRKGVAKKEDWEKFSSHISYQIADITKSSNFKPFKAIIEKFKKEWNQETSIVY